MVSMRSALCWCDCVCANMRVCLVGLVIVSCLGRGDCAKMRPTSTINYQTQKHNKQSIITIKVMVHFDHVLTNNLEKHKTRAELISLSRTILKQATTLLNHPSINQMVNLTPIGTKFLNNHRNLVVGENAREYLKSYCDWQMKKKLAKRRLYYSVLLTGIDLTYVKDNKIVRASTARSYTGGACQLTKSCAIIEYDPKLTGYLLAHELGHSLGMRHDGPPYNRCHQQNHIMAARYKPQHHPNSWSLCSMVALKQFLNKNYRSWCVKKNEDLRVGTLRYY